MRSTVLFALALLLAAACGRVEAPPQARPVETWLAAVAEGRSDVAEETDSLDSTAERLRATFGAFVPEDFEFLYQGTDHAGEVILLYRGEDCGVRVPVVRAGHGWRMGRG